MFKNLINKLKCKRGAIDLDGTGDYINAGNVSELDFGNTDTFSASYWIKQDVLEYKFHIGKSLSSGNFTGWNVYNEFSLNDRIAFQMRYDYSPSNQQTIYTDPDGISTDRWYHVAVTYSGSGSASGMKIYIDGQEKAVSVVNDTLVTTTANSGSFNIGNRNGGSNEVNAKMSEVAVWNVELTADEVLQLACKLKRIPLQIRPLYLVAYYPLDDVRDGVSANGVSFRDLSASNNPGTGINGVGYAEEVLSYVGESAIITTAVSVAVNATATPALASASITVEAPTIVTGVAMIANPALASQSVIVNAPSLLISKGATVTPTAIETTIEVGTASASTSTIVSSTATPALVQVTLSVGSPSVVTGSGAIATPSIVSNTILVFTPLIAITESKIATPSLGIITLSVLSASASSNVGGIGVNTYLNKPSKITKFLTIESQLT